MVLEYVEGKSLRDYMLRTGPLDVPLVLSLMRQVASALYRASELGIIHRDIKPENILLTRKGEAKVADFGLSRCLAVDQPVDLTRSGTTVGTPLYMSPEQVEGKVVDYRSDIYSFGVTCYHMLAGHTPFAGSNAFEIAIKHVRDEPPPLETIRPDFPPALCAVVRKMMAKKPQARYQSARDLLKDIARVRAIPSAGTTGSISVGTIDAETVPAGARAPRGGAAAVVWRCAGRRWMPRWGAGAGGFSRRCSPSWRPGIDGPHRTPLPLRRRPRPTRPSHAGPSRRAALRPSRPDRSRHTADRSVRRRLPPPRRPRRTPPRRLRSRAARKRSRRRWSSTSRTLRRTRPASATASTSASFTSTGAIFRRRGAVRAHGRAPVPLDVPFRRPPRTRRHRRPEEGRAATRTPSSRSCSTPRTGTIG